MLICRSFQVESHPEKYRGDYEYTVVLVGANNLGRRNLQSSVTCVKKIMGILSDLNPAAMALACEVIDISLQTIGQTKLAQRGCDPHSARGRKM